MENKNFDIVIVAGQSNAEGNGLGNSELTIKNINAYMLIDKFGTIPHPFDGTGTLTYHYPFEIELLPYKEKEASEGGTLGELATTFADLYVKNQLKPGRNLLIIKAAAGGTGFFLNQWGVNNPLSDRLIFMVDTVLNNYPNSKVVALLWHQGEHDAFEQKEAHHSLETIYKDYKNGFLNQMNLIRNRYGNNFPIIAGEFVNGWSNDYKEELQQVINATNEVLESFGFEKMIKTDDLNNNDDTVHNGDNIHYCKKSVYELGKRYYLSYVEQKKVSN